MIISGAIPEVRFRSMIDGLNPCTCLGKCVYIPGELCKVKSNFSNQSTILSECLRVDLIWVDLVAASPYHH
jgi:hypothetical protein